jgi:hypothetical protein
MSKEQKKEKRILENLEHIVAGEKLSDDPSLDNDTKTALELTREMTNWSKPPSREFKKQLKVQLIHQFAEQEKKEISRDGLSEFRELLHRQAWQLTIGAAIVVIIAGIVYLVIYLLGH